MFDVLEPEDPRHVGRYRIVARIGAGGMGQVYLGRSPGGRPVAVKVVRPELAGDGDFRRRFAREVTAARRVNGAFTAGVVDADPDGSPAWLATVYVSGVPLGEAVARHGPWPAGSVFALGAGLAEALEAIHAAGVVHRDLKPSNVLLAPDGPRVIDFGISSASEASALTRTGMTIGTPGFMSPEQLTGRPVGPASDVFSLGAVMAYTAAGVGPFGTGTPHALHFRAVYEQPDLDALPQELRGIVAACLAKEPDRRPTVADLLRRMTVRGDGEPSDAALLPAEPGWLPDAVNRLVREQATGELPRTPLATVPDASPAPTPTAPDLPAAPPVTRPDPGRPSPHEAPTRTADHAVSASPDAPAGTAPDGAPAPLSRRGALLALTGTALAAGTAVAAWKLSDGGSGAAGPPSAGHTTTPKSRPVSSTPQPTHASGQQIWAFATDDEVHTAPAVANGVVYFGSNDKNLYAVDAATGRKRWSFPTDNALYSSPAVANGVVYVGTHDNNLYALDAATGEKRWAFPTGSTIDSPPVVAGDVVYVGSNDENLYAVDAVTGKKRWSFRCRKDGMVEARPTVVGGTVYVASWDDYLYALDAATGRKRWEFATGDYVDSSPAVAGGLVYVSSDRLFAVDAATGKQRWARRGRKFTIPGAGYRAFSPPAVAGGVVYAGDEIEYLYALNAATGAQRWAFHTGNSVFSTPVVADGVVYVGSDDKSVYAVDTATGKRRWAFSTGGAIGSPLTLAGGVLYAGSADHKLYALQT
ncbi:PQQ-binding-like beta-propeller repeat protein [Streptomyces cocklensis]|uniref:Non-specific serine/threonine protein kinase n=1 Tax=Actinacidiphila cocklensis TaxID=887465 RepID=A0A9W4GSQ4_9ACTN|nr:PQQ-binding-like beta-propeller repeat protein [Actinacidiphila cocklensis]MDD1063103.1 PQQ-binding-like beta-propeller repeat protein [Actinacidiphila cocklensis]CAG6395541.1 Non-specific serine/threonine protein kinase [Actinacidiphila cocklensis]